MGHLTRGDGPRLAFEHRQGRGPTVIFLPGYASDMSGTKALSLDGWAAREGRALLRFDYAGCGASEGAFAAQTLAGWRDDVLAMIDRVEGPAILVGSSMGGWLMLLAALERPERVAGLVGVAPAPDFTDWGFTLDEKMTILREGRIERPSYYDAPLVTTRTFWQSGEANRILHRALEIDCPLRVIHGQRDPDVPWRNSLELMGRVRSDDVHLTLVRDGDHRLSRPGDIALLLRTVADLVETS